MAAFFLFFREKEVVGKLKSSLLVCMAGRVFFLSFWDWEFNEKCFSF